VNREPESGGVDEALNWARFAVSGKG